MASSEFARGEYEAALDALRLVDQLRRRTANDSVSILGYGYGLLGQPDDAQRLFDDLNDLADEQYIDSMHWAWAYMGVGDYDEALRQVNSAAENPELISYRPLADFIRLNIWSDPVLEQPEWVEVRNRLRPM